MSRARNGNRGWGNAIVALVAVLAAPAPAAAEQAGNRDPHAREAARAKLREGVKLLEAGSYVPALALFREAHAIFPSPRIQYNMALAYEKLGRWGPAFTSFERFLRAPVDAPAEHVRHSREQLERLAPKVAFVTLSCDVSDADVILDGDPIDKTPLARPLAVDTGPHEIVVRHPKGESQPRRFNVVAGQAIKIEVALATPATPAPAQLAFSGPIIEPRRPDGGSDASQSVQDSPVLNGWLRPTRWVTAAGAVVGASVGLMFNLRANSKRKQFENLPPSGSPPRKCGLESGSVVGGQTCHELAAAYEGAKTAAIVSYAAGGTLAVASVVLFLLEDDPGRGTAFLPGTSWSPFGVTYATSF